VLLRLCDPFVEPLSGKAWGKLDAGCAPTPAGVSRRTRVRAAVAGPLDSERSRAAARGRRYVTDSRRLSFAEDAKLAAEFEEQRRLLAERAASGGAAGPPAYHFVCECFFLTAKGLHLGLVKLLADWHMLLMARARLARSSRAAAQRSECPQYAPRAQV
jgi:ubiquitin conjugation factor E4 B